MIAEIFGPDLAVVAVIVAALLFGGSAIPKLARNIGRAREEFRSGLTTSSAPEPDTSEA